jgi:hypothetical protein
MRPGVVARICQQYPIFHALGDRAIPSTGGENFGLTTDETEIVWGSDGGAPEMVTFFFFDDASEASSGRFLLCSADCAMFGKGSVAGYVSTIVNHWFGAAGCLLASMQVQERQNTNFSAGPAVELLALPAAHRPKLAVLWYVPASAGNPLQHPTTSLAGV